jgi:hypothetical protein
MPRQIVRFYARALRPTWDFLDREIPPQEIVRRFGRSYGGEPLGGGWYLTVVLESERCRRDAEAMDRITAGPFVQWRTPAQSRFRGRAPLQRCRRSGGWNQANPLER